jgi:Na+/phosphate symporter
MLIALKLLGAMTSNRLSGVATGALVTVAVQSSAATTVMTVSFVNAALLTLTQAISIIMGANIGTTMSAWIMSAGFSFNIVKVVWPDDVIVTASTVDVNITRLRKKIGAYADCIVTRAGSGYSFQE